MPEENNAPQWAIVELMGHVRTGGLVSKDTMLSTPLLRVDVPIDAGDAFVTQLVNPSSIYRMTMCSEDLARAAAKLSNPMPLHSWEMPKPTIEDRAADSDTREPGTVPHAEYHDDDDQY